MEIPAKTASPGNRQLLDAVGQRLRRTLERIVDPAPQVAVNKQLLPQQGHQPGQAPAQPRPQLQKLDEQNRDPCCPNLDFQRVGRGPHEGLHPQVLLQRLEEQLSGKGLARC